MVRFDTPQVVTNAACCSDPLLMCEKCAAAALAASNFAPGDLTPTPPPEPPPPPNYFGQHAGQYAGANLAAEAPLTNTGAGTWGVCPTVQAAFEEAAKNRKGRRPLTANRAPAAPAKHPDSEREDPLPLPRWPGGGGRDDG